MTAKVLLPAAINVRRRNWPSVGPVEGQGGAGTFSIVWLGPVVKPMGSQLAGL